MNYKYIKKKIYYFTEKGVKKKRDNFVNNKINLTIYKL